MMTVLRFMAAVLFGVGLYGTAREWLYARKHGHPITRAEKIYLVLALPLIFAAQLALDLMGVAPVVATTGSAFALSMALNLWAIKRRMERPSSLGLGPSEAKEGRQSRSIGRQRKQAGNEREL